MCIEQREYKREMDSKKINTFLKRIIYEPTFCHILQNLSQKDKEFFDRVFADGIVKYENRILNLDFQGKHCKVLDAGGGFGQWSIALSLHNAFVDCIEYQANRVEVLKKLIEDTGLDNLNVLQGSIESLPEKWKKSGGVFDFVFCYGVIFLTNWKKSLKQLLDVTKQGGLIYICANDIGWYYNLIINMPNSTSGYDPRSLGVQAFVNEYRYEICGEEFLGDRVLRLESIEKEIKKYDCSLVSVSGEGGILYEKGGYQATNNQGFFAGEYYGERGVYEILLRKN